MRLGTINLWGNNLTGDFPESIGTNRNASGGSYYTVAELYLGGGNHFQGCVPDDLLEVTWFHDLSSLQLPTCSGAPLENKQERTKHSREALEALFNATDGPNWINNTHWLSDAPISLWYGVGLSSDFVETLVLQQNGLSGSIPPQIVDLARLRTLSLENNDLTGLEPDHLYQLKSLRDLRVRGNESIILNSDWPDCIPDEWERIESDHPFFESQICVDPYSLESDKEALIALYEATDGDNWKNNQNWLTDAPLGEWHGIETRDDGRVIFIQLYENGLTGSIPHEIGDLSKLTQLVITGGNLNGPIPAAIGRLEFFEAAPNAKKPTLGRNTTRTGPTSVPAEFVLI